MATKRPFKMPTYKTYDPQAEGFGNADEWVHAFKVRMGIAEANEVVGSDSPYSILGLKDNAPWEAVKKAYRALAMQHHPDHGGDAEVFKKVAGAYRVIEDRVGA